MDFTKLLSDLDLEIDTLQTARRALVLLVPVPVPTTSALKMVMEPVKVSAYKPWTDERRKRHAARMRKQRRNRKAGR